MYASILLLLGLLWRDRFRMSFDILVKFVGCAIFKENETKVKLLKYCSSFYWARSFEARNFWHSLEERDGEGVFQKMQKFVEKSALQKFNWKLFICLSMQNMNGKLIEMKNAAAAEISRNRWNLNILNVIVVVVVVFKSPQCNIFLSRKINSLAIALL